jgi:hypothetical protein
VGDAGTDMPAANGRHLGVREFGAAVGLLPRCRVEDEGAERIRVNLPANTRNWRRHVARSAPCEATGVRAGACVFDTVSLLQLLRRFVPPPPRVGKLFLVRDRLRSKSLCRRLDGGRPRVRLRAHQPDRLCSRLPLRALAQLQQGLLLPEPGHPTVRGQHRVVWARCVPSLCAVDGAA